MRRALCTLFAVLMFAGCTAAVILPLPQAAGAAQQTYVCRWAEGETRETYASAYPALVGAGKEGAVLERAGERGVVAPTAAYRALYDVLEGGSLAVLLEQSAAGLARIERAAVFRTFAPRLWYARDDWFAWNGNCVVRTSLSARSRAETLTLFSDPPSPSVLAALGAKRLIFPDILAKEGLIEAADLVGTAVEAVTMSAPYAFAGGVVTLDTPGGRRIVCGMPTATALTLPDAEFADEGALLACERLASVTIPFAGSAKSAVGSRFTGQFAHLFCESDGTFRVPETLREITVTGGTLAAFAFYACPAVERVNACGVAAERISEQAFAGMDGLQALHSPRADVMLTGYFTASPLACGCTLFVRS